MSKKIAVVLDTNFIIEHKTDLHDLHESLSKNNDVYVTEISINERISQKYLVLKSIYEKIESFKNENSAYITLKYKDAFEKRAEDEKKRTLDGYEKEFKSCIIPFNPNEEVFKTVLDRVYKKIAPFLNKDNASDKGFKDTLIWMSILKYFKELDGDVEVAFITNDNGFLKNSDTLQAEFSEVTGKSLLIKDNNYFEVLLGEKHSGVSIDDKPSKSIDFDRQAMRDRIENTVNDICNTITYDYYGNENWERTFKTTEKFDVDYIKAIFRSMRGKVNDHIFENQIAANSILDIDGRINAINPIQMRAIEEVAMLYEEILTKYPEFIEPFFGAVSEIMNRNFDENFKFQNTEDDELPF